MQRDELIMSTTWQQIKEELNWMFSEVIESTRLATKYELDAHRIAVVQGSRPSSIDAQIEAGYIIPLTGPQRTAIAKEIQVAFGIADQESEPVPPYLKASSEAPIRIVERSIQAQELSLDFVAAWGRLKYRYAQLADLVEGSSRALRDFEKGERGAEKADTTCQRYWYAHWLSSHDVFKQPQGEARDQSRRVAEEELARLCWLIGSGKIQPVLFPADWFSKMQTSLDDGVRSAFASTSNRKLKSTYTRLSYQELADYVANSLISASDLPPTDLSAFQST